MQNIETVVENHGLACSPACPGLYAGPGESLAAAVTVYLPPRTGRAAPQELGISACDSQRRAELQQSG